MTAADIVLVNWICPYCGHTIRPSADERAVADVVGHELQYRHVVCPGEREHAIAQYRGKGGI